MRKKNIRILDQPVRQEFLPYVRRPSRYIGGEVNQIRKDLPQCDLTFALCFPDIYEIGMSHTGMAIMYDLLNCMEGVAAERVFSPWVDAEEVMREKQIPLFSLESRGHVADFDVMAFTLSTELCYTTMLNMLDLAGLAVRACDRDENTPLVLVGNQMANCCEPIAPFVDCVLLGQAEEILPQVVELLRKEKAKGARKSEALLRLACEFPFAYVPSLYKFEYHNSHVISFTSKQSDLRMEFEDAVVRDLDAAPVPKAPIVPFAQAVHERVSVEVMRGCPGRCRFCQAGYCRRPLRYRSVEKVVEIARAAYEATGFDTVSLLSLSTADYPWLEELVEKLQEYFEPRHVGISLPSLKVQAQLKLLPKLVSSVRKSGLTIAVEAASEKLREGINKPITNEDLFVAVEAAYAAGFQKLKLYFMVGFPGEKEADIVEIVDLCDALARLRRKVDGKTASINAAISWLVPKPHTPFGWLGQKSAEYFERAKELILSRKRQVRAKFVQFKFHEIEQSVLESVFGRGDRRLADVIEAAWRNGARLDLWKECFDFEIWQDAFAAAGMNLHVLAQRSFGTEEILPWQHLGGPDTEYLLRHLDKAMSALSNEEERDV